MKSFKKSLIVLSVLALTGFAGTKSFAQEIGVVDYDKVYSSYTKAQDIAADLEVKAADLQKYIADAQKKLKATSSPLERKNLEEKITQEFQAKKEEFNTLRAKQSKLVEDNINSAILKVRDQGKLDVVLNKVVVIVGGKDITDQVITSLNATK